MLTEYFTTESKQVICLAAVDYVQEQTLFLKGGAALPVTKQDAKTIKQFLTRES